MGYNIKNNKVFYTAKGYWREYELPETSIKNFSILGEHHAKNNTHVYYQNRPIEYADPDSFISLDDEYGKDKNSVFWQTVTIENADPTSFISLGNGFAQDRNHYYECTRIMDHPPTKQEIEKIVESKKDFETSLKEKIKSGDLTALDELINILGEDHAILEVFIWAHVAIELNHNYAEFTELIEILKDEDLSENQIIKGHKKIAEIFSEGKWVQKNDAIAEKYIKKSI